MIKKVLFCVFYLFFTYQFCDAEEVENSDKFELYTSATLAPEDNSANESNLMPNETPINSGDSLLLFFAGLYVCFHLYKGNRSHSVDK